MVLGGDMLGFMGLPDLLPFVNLLSLNTAFGFFLGAGGVQASWKAFRSHRRRKKSHL